MKISQKKYNQLGETAWLTQYCNYKINQKEKVKVKKDYEKVFFLENLCKIINLFLTLLFKDYS